MASPGHCGEANYIVDFVVNQIGKLIEFDLVYDKVYDLVHRSESFSTVGMLGIPLSVELCALAFSALSSM